MLLLALPAIAAQAPDPEKQQQAVRAQMERLQKEQDENLKRSNPAAFEKIERERERNKKISEVVAAFRAKKLDESEARRRLEPLMREQARAEPAALDGEIAHLEKRLAQLKEQKADPGKAARERVDLMLGLRLPKADGVHP